MYALACRNSPDGMLEFLLEEGADLNVAYGDTLQAAFKLLTDEWSADSACAKIVFLQHADLRLVSFPHDARDSIEPWHIQKAFEVPPKGLLTLLKLTENKRQSEWRKVS